MLKCMCRELGKCLCDNECRHYKKWTECYCVEYNQSCECVMYPASKANAPAYLIGKDERQFDL